MAVNTSIPGTWSRAPTPVKSSARGMSADAIARSPTIVGKKAATAEKAAVKKAVVRQGMQAAAAGAYAPGPTFESADAISASPSMVGEEAAAAELEARRQGAARLAEQQRLATPVFRQSGSGRQAEQTGTIGSPNAGGLAAPPPVFVPPESVTAPPAVIQPPAVVAQAAPSEVNVPGESFTTIGSPGSFGAYERRRTSRGPKTGLSVTPDMLRAAASQRLG